MGTLIARLLGIVALGALLTACSAAGNSVSGAVPQVGAQVDYSPPLIPIVVSINTFGEISVQPRAGIDVPIPRWLGDLEVNAIAQVEAADYFGVENVLTVRVDGEDHFYDLDGGQFSVEFESGYYEKVALNTDGRGNILLEVDRTSTGSNPASGSEKSGGSSSGCSDALAPRLTVGTTGQVTTYNNDLAVWIRSSASSSGAKISKMEAGESFTVLSGPICDEAKQWWFWEVQSAVTGHRGWSAEGDASMGSMGYFLEP